jgi:hypothetical protein
LAISRTHFSAGVTAFLDILGFSERIIAAKTTKDIERIIADIESIQRAFGFKSKDKSVKEVHALSKKTVLAFSDSVVVNIAMRSKLVKLEGTFDTIWGELDGIALAQGQCVASGLFLRGGVDIGWWYRKSTILASESLVRAYKAEGRAVVPVIRLTDELYESLLKHPDRKFYSEDTEPVRNLLRQYTGTGPDGKPVSFWYLDYLSVVVESIGWETSAAQRQKCMAAPREKRERIREMGYRMNIRNWLKHHARMIKQAHAEAKDGHVKAKYEWLAGYHNEIAVRYTPSPVALCNLKTA